MSISFHVRKTRTCILALASAAVVVGAFVAVPASGASGRGPEGPRTVDARPALEAGRYIVLLREPGATGYDGGTRDLARTSVADDRSFDAEAGAVREYVAHLRDGQDRVARRVGADVDRRYSLVANGFTADLTGRQATKLAEDRDVLMVVPDERRHLDTWNTPDALGMTGKKGAWRRYAGSREDAGDGVVVGVIDSGIWPESRSFSGRRLTSTPQTKWNIVRHGQTVRMRKADGEFFKGRCQLSHRVDGVRTAAEDWNAGDCNTKLIAARYYPEEFLAEVSEQDRSPVEVVSARDGNGHGTHTAGTAAGRTVDRVAVEGVRFGEVSGMAPAAKIAAYKVCFDDNDEDTGDCFNGAIIAAIEDAVADGVDVLNFSISGATDTVLDATEFAFEGAAEAGVFVATSAGNAGPGESTVAHNSPWVTTVAATSHATFENTVVLGNGTRIRGASISRTAVPSTRLVRSAAVPADGATVGDADLCMPGSLDPARVEGRIVVCTRGENARVEKSEVVAAAGGVGMVLANVVPGGLDADFHSVPTVHVSDTDSPAVFDYLETAGSGATAAIVRGDVTGLPRTPVPQIADFSSRGPALANGSDLLKPDLAAPGVGVLAAVAPPNNENRKFDLYSGTSMASPHVAGLAAFMLAERPRWSPMKVKSAMMTTARSARTADGSLSRDPYAQGAGEVRPRRSFDPGLFVLSGALDWRRFYQGQGLDWQEGYVPLAAKDLNGPSLADGQVTARTTFRRVFTATRAGTWKVTVQVPGFDATTATKLVAARAGDRETLTIRFTRTTAPIGEFRSGYVVLDGPTRVRLPVSLRAVSVKAPNEVRGTGTTGSTTVPITAGFTGDLEIGVSGLVEAETTSETATDITEGYDDERYFCFEVTSGSRAARFDLDAENDAGDMDLMVIPVDPACEVQVDTELLSATAAADERVTILDPAPGWYLAAVDPFAAPPGEDRLAWRLDVYDVNQARVVNELQATPNPVPVVNNESTSYDAAWAGLRRNSRYLGVLDYEGALSPTFLTVDTGL